MRLSTRRLKKDIRRRLGQEDLQKALEDLCQFPPRRTVNPLFSLLLDRETLIRWRAVTAMGVVVAQLADSRLESARVVMRRMIWMLNDESGGIGWGVPESMGETLARSAVLAHEYDCMLISYCREEGNYLEHPILQRGAVWGLGRLAHARPSRVAGCGELLLPYLESPDPVLRGTAVWATMAFDNPRLRQALKNLVQDRASLEIYSAQKLRGHTVGGLAEEALQGGHSS
jgi:hypothetical protein